MSKHNKTTKGEESLEVVLTREEIHERAEIMAAAVTKIEDLESAKRAVVAQFRDDIDAAKVKLSDASRVEEMTDDEAQLSLSL